MNIQSIPGVQAREMLATGDGVIVDSKKLQLLLSERDTLRAELAEARERWLTSEKWRTAYQEGKGELYAMGGAVAEAAMEHLPCSEATVDRWFRAEYVHRDAVLNLTAERDQLRASNARLRAGLEEIAEMQAQCYGDATTTHVRLHGICEGDFTRGVRDTIRALLAETPAQSLAAAKAKTLRGGR